jgi:uncharacterized heparinase superfamily protein
MINMIRLSSKYLDGYWINKSLKLSCSKKFLSYPDPYEIGKVEYGKLLLSGMLKFQDELIEMPNRSIWKIEKNSIKLENYLQGFDWLNDLAAVGNFEALKLAQEWVFEWILSNKENGQTEWGLETLTCRVFNWISHSGFLLKTQNLTLSQSYIESIERQAFFLEKRWKSLKSNIIKFKALVLLISVGIYIDDKKYLIPYCSVALDKEINNTFDSGGGIYSRDPNILSQIFSLLTWTEILLKKIEFELTESHKLIILKVAPILRSLRHSDGSLLGFRGKTEYPTKHLDRALINSGVKHSLPKREAMGYARLGRKNVSIFVDTGGQFDSVTEGNFLDTKSAIEITINKCPFIISGAKATDMAGKPRGNVNKIHNSSALKLGNELVNVVNLQPANLEWIESKTDTILKTSHSGYLLETGLTQTRMLKLNNDETQIYGEDSFNAISEDSRFKFENIFRNNKKNGIKISINFLLHPEVAVVLENGSINFCLTNGERYSLSYSNKYHVEIEENNYYEDSKGKLSATKQVVLSSYLMNYDNTMNWSITKF